MSGRAVFAPLPAGETRTVKYDFASDLASGETISTQSVAATVYSGSDASPAGLISGSATASGSVVSQNVVADTAGTIYNTTCTITTSGSRTLVKQAFLACVPLAL